MTHESKNEQVCRLMDAGGEWTSTKIRSALWFDRSCSSTMCYLLKIKCVRLIRRDGEGNKAINIYGSVDGGSHEAYKSFISGGKERRVKRKHERTATSPVKTEGFALGDVFPISVPNTTSNPRIVRHTW